MMTTGARKNYRSVVSPPGGNLQKVWSDSLLLFLEERLWEGVLSILKDRSKPSYTGFFVVKRITWAKKKVT